jgi:hypothetical protein
MRSIRLHLKPSVPFWILSSIRLDQTNPKSVLIDIDKLTQDHINIINRSVDSGEIFILDNEGKRVSSIAEVERKTTFSVSTEDEDDSYMPKITSVTISIEEEEEEKESYDEEALLVLSKNGNTLKKIISSMSNFSIENVKLLEAMLRIERNNKNRDGIIDAIKKVLEA